MHREDGDAALSSLRLTHWRAPEDPRLSTESVHVWIARLSQQPELIGELLVHLTPEEVARAAQFHFDRDRHRFIVAHAALRTILGSYLRLPPNRVALEYNRYGKPSLTPACGLEFNLSHSGEVALMAFARNRRIGVDLEFVREDLSLDELADTFFSASERRALTRLSGEARVQAFYRCWCRKEAYLKAQGLGLNLPLDSFDVLVDTTPSDLGDVADRRDLIEGWSFREPDLGPNYVGSLAIEGFCDASQHFLWSPTLSSRR